MRYMNATEAAAKWGLTARRVRVLCNDGKIDGAEKSGYSWIMPENTPRPIDGRVIRKYKSRNIRFGVVDVDKIEELKKKRPLGEGLKKSEAFSRIVENTLTSLLSRDGKKTLSSTVEKILSLNLVPTTSFETHLIIINFRSVLFSLIGKSERWTRQSLFDTYCRLMQGLEDSVTFRKAFVDYGEGLKLSVEDAIESVFKQYESSWKNLHPLASSVILYTYMLKIVPFDRYNNLFSYLILAGELMRGGIIPPLFTLEREEEEKAALLMAIKMDNFAQLTSYFENGVKEAYEEVEKGL